MPTRHRLFTKVVLCLFLSLCAGLTRPSSAQNSPLSTTTLVDFGTGNPLQFLRQRLAQTNTATSLLPMEGAVDPAEYVVGPGDFFTVSIEGLQATLPPIPVTADGHLLLPDAGSITAAGETLATVRTQALTALKARYERVDVDVTLAQPRQFYVHVSGAVPVPGRYLAMPVARVSTVLELAFADTTRTPVSNPDYRPSLRNIRLIRRDGGETTLDLLRYFVTGDTAHNPYLRDGDVVYVPSYAPNYASVYIDGAVPFPGAYDHRPGETAADLLRLAGYDAGGRIRLTRRHPDGTVETRDLAPEALWQGTSVSLQPLDHLSVTPDRLPGGTATVEGFVFNPGTYPIVQGRTTLQELLTLAGGLRPGASARLAYLERRSLPRPMPRRQTQNRFEPGPGRPVLLRPDTLAVMQRLRMTDLDFMSRVYFAQEMRLQSRVSVDLEAALTDGAAPIYLRDGDRLVVPRDEQTVYVFGQVIRPGYVAYVPDRPAQYYIDAAQGAGPLAKGAYVVDAATGAYRPAAGAPVHSGDMIFLDRIEDVADSPELQRLVIEESRARADARIRTMQTLLQTIGTIAGVVSVIVLATRN